jgi:hypothetical protein
MLLNAFRACQTQSGILSDMSLYVTKAVEYTKSKIRTLEVDIQALVLKRDQKEEKR